MFTDAYDQGVVEKAARFQVEDEGRVALVEAGQEELLEPGIMVGMRVPAGPRVAIGVPEDCSHPAAGFNKTASGEQRLAEQVDAVALAAGQGLALDVRACASWGEVSSEYASS